MLSGISYTKLFTLYAVRNKLYKVIHIEARDIIQGTIVQILDIEALAAKIASV